MRSTPEIHPNELLKSSNERFSNDSAETRGKLPIRDDVNADVFNSIGGRDLKPSFSTGFRT